MFSLVPNGRETVTSVGSAWIICRSKSFAGRIYYFNTLTGEAVWNLSETEVEKAKFRTKILQSQPGFVIENCPEPPESPKDDQTSNKHPSSNINQFPQHNMAPPKVYNKQVINNRFPTSATLCTPHQYHVCNPMNPIQFNIPVAPVSNPPIWDAAPQPILITPTYSQPQPYISNNNFDHAYFDNKYNTLSNRFRRLSGDGHTNKNIIIRHNKYQHHKSPNNSRVNKSKNINSKIDLRLLLSLKRRENQIKEKESQLQANAAATSNNEYKQGFLNPLSTRIRRKSYCLDPNEEEGRVNYDDYEHSNFNKKQDGSSPHPSRIIRRRYSFNANQEENNDCLEHLTIKNPGTNQDALRSLPSRRRSVSFSANEGKNDDHNEWLEQSKNKLHTDTNQSAFNMHQLHNRSFSFIANEGENDENDDWQEQSNNKYTDTSQGDFSSQPLAVRRRRSCSFSANQKEETQEHSNNKNANQCDVSPLLTHRKSVRFKLNEEDGDNNVWLDENLKTQRDINSSERKAVTSLSQVKENSVDTYIVPDSNVFLEKIALLNDILNTDKRCCLLVPKMVMNKLQAATKSRCRAQAYKALYFICQQHEANLAVIEEESEENEINEDDILNFCCQLIDQEIHVVLLTDDTELINRDNDNNTNIRIITTVKMQQIVDEYKCNETTSTDIDTEALANVKITIENKSNIQHNEEVNSPIRKCMNPEKSFDENRGEGGADTVFQKDKKACDVGVQASFNLSSVSSSSNTDVGDEFLLPDSTKANDNVPCKIGGIKLKRNLSTDSKKNSFNRYNTNSTVSLANDRTKVGNVAELTYPHTHGVVTDSTINENTQSDGKNLAWSLFSNTSTDSLNKINEGSDTSSIVFRNVNQRENIIIEDSNSVISNTTSNVDTESERSGVQKANTNIDDRIVMFEVSDSRMEEALRVKMDEWVSRFVQIMEEALSQLLQREPTFALEPMPPPWTVHEAVECVRKHFCHDPDVLAAAERLLDVSRDHGGLRGKIKSNISPHKYMELYSYGVYLIDALQGVLSSNEDLQTASEALSKLLNDVQQSHSDSVAQDSFTDISAQECDANVTSDKDTSQVEVNQGANKQEIPKGSPTTRNKKKQSPASTPSTPGKYNLRSQRKKNVEENREASDNITFIRTIDPESSFFSSLDLKKITFSNNQSVTEKPQQIIELGTSDNIQEKSPMFQKRNEHISSSQEKSPILQNTNEQINSSGESTAPILNGDPKMNEPKIIRNFFKCVEFEEKLKNKTGLLDNQNWTYDDDDETDEGGLVINEDYIEDYQSNNFMDSDYYTNYVEDLWFDGHNPGVADFNGSLENSKAINTNHGDKAITFKLLMDGLESDILKAYTSIKDFCETSSESLQSEDLSADDTSRMLARAEKTGAYICKVCDQLESVLRRENTHQSIFQILRRKESTDVVVEDGDMEDYRDFIANCLEQGSMLKESVDLVLRACKLKAA